jgi:hypothetical protein
MNQCYYYYYYSDCYWTLSLLSSSSSPPVHIPKRVMIQAVTATAMIVLVAIRAMDSDYSHCTAVYSADSSYVDCYSRYRHRTVGIGVDVADVAAAATAEAVD